ncbi:YbdK family carboxylate-amine ligase [Chryseolinea sp. T2]|uniref:carboxylate-amine ligase n=1 Tax=Chryseolinea sp. T2 TaxID=3129255 RepID=UPI003077B4F2
MKKSQNEPLEFKTTGDQLSLGVEVELQVLDERELRLTPKAQTLLDACENKKFDKEFFQSTLEIKTDICKDAHDVEKDLTGSIDQLNMLAAANGLAIGASGTHPLSDYRDHLITPSDRYAQLIDRNQWIVRRMAVYGMHIHIGMRSGDDCIKHSFFFFHLLPHLLGLSASSPFWQGKDTGLCACRPTTYEALPTAGMPYLVKNWREFQKLYQFLLRSKSIQGMKDLWWDIRPSPQYGTLELRFCDQPATRDEMTAIVAFVHLLAFWFRDHEEEWNSKHASVKKWIIRENKWRTLRYGLDAEIVVTSTGRTRSLRKDVLDWLDRLSPYIAALNYGRFADILRDICFKGNSAQRQRKIFEKTNDVGQVIAHNVLEYRNGHPDWLS